MLVGVGHGREQDYVHKLLQEEDLGDIWCCPDASRCHAWPCKPYVRIYVLLGFVLNLSSTLINFSLHLLIITFFDS